MKYIKEKDTRTFDLIGITLGCMYLFFTYLGESVFFPSFLNRVTLMLFLAYGALSIFSRVNSGMFVLSKYSIWYGVVICYIVVTFPLSSYSNSINSNHFYEMIICFVLTLLLRVFVNSEKEVCWICWTYVLSSILMIFLMFRSGKLVGNYKERLGEDILGNANIFATFIMYSVMYAIWLLIYRKYPRRTKVFLCVCILINIYALMLSAGRKFFMIPFVFLFLLLLMKDSSSARNAIKYIFLMAIIIGVLYFLITQVPMFYNAIGIRMEQFVNSLTGGGKVDQSSILRSRMRAAAIEGWLQKPIFGNGFDSFKYIKSSEVLGGSRAYSHCNYTEMLYNGGIVCWLLYYSIFGIMIRETIRNKAISRQFRAFSVAAIISQFVLDYGGVFYDMIASQVFIMLAIKMTEFTDEDNCRIQGNESRYING